MRLIENKTWNHIARGGSKEGHRLLEPIAVDFAKGKANDNCHYLNLNKKFKTLINERNNWSYSINIYNNNNCWYTDGSLKNDKAAIGIFNPSNNLSRSIRISDHCNIFQAEMVAVNECAKICLEKEKINSDIVILTDNQSVVKSLSDLFIRSSTTLNCITTLNRLGLDNRVTIAWVPSHSKVHGNIKADYLAKQGIRNKDIEIFVNPTSAFTDEKIKNVFISEAINRWRNSKCKNHAKNFISGFEQFKSNYLLSMNRRDIRIVTGLLTGHALTMSFLEKLGKTDDITCRMCLDADETVEHWLSDCEAFPLRDATLYDCGNISTKDVHYKDILKFANSGFKEISKSFLCAD